MIVQCVRGFIFISHLKNFVHAFGNSPATNVIPCHPPPVAGWYVCLTCNSSTPLHHRSSEPRALRTVVSNTLDLDLHVLGQGLDSNAAACGLVCEVLLEDAVHLSKVCHVVEEDVDLDDAVHADVDLAEDALDVLTACLGLVCDAAFDELAVGGAGDLAGDVDLGSGYDGLGL